MDFKSYETILEELEKEYEYKRNSFIIMVKNEINTTCFERNAMSDLAVMLELKSQIKALKMVVANLRLCTEE